MRFSFTVLGCNAALPAFGRHPSAHVLTLHDQQYLLDCGEGTQIRLTKFGFNRNKLKAIFITHLHGDHCFGLPGLLTSFSLTNRTTPLTIVGPAGLQEMMQVILQTTGAPIPYPLTYVVADTQRSVPVYENEHLSVYTLPLAHRIPTCGYLFVEKSKPKNIIPDQIERYRIPFNLIPSIKLGANFVTPHGIIIPNEDLTLQPTTPLRFAYCTDTVYLPALAEWIKGCDMVYHEATYLHELAEQATLSMHTTALQAAQLAKDAQVKKLIIGHFSSRYKTTTALLKEARSVFKPTETAKEGKTYFIG